MDGLLEPISALTLKTTGMPVNTLSTGCLAVGVSGYIYAQASSGNGATASAAPRNEPKEEKIAKAVGPRIMGRSTEAMRRSPSPTKPASISTFHTY
jgi:hypothetical protein